MTCSHLLDTLWWSSLPAALPIGSGVVLYAHLPRQQADRNRQLRARDREKEEEERRQLKKQRREIEQLGALETELQQKEVRGRIILARNGRKVAADSDARRRTASVSPAVFALLRRRRGCASRGSRRRARSARSRSRRGSESASSSQRRSRCC